MQGNAPFELHEFKVQQIRAHKVTISLLQNKDVFRTRDLHNSIIAAAVGETDGLVIIAYNDAERQAFTTLTATMTINEVIPDSDWRALTPYYLSHFSLPAWRTLERYHSPDGHYYAAVWPDEARLSILRQGGQIVIETLATEFAPPQATCHLIPIRWLPDSSGVLFFSRCKDSQSSAWLSRHALLLLPLPDQ